VLRKHVGIPPCYNRARGFFGAIIKRQLYHYDGVVAHSGSLTRAAFLSARNDALANIAIIAAGLVTAATVSPWPDLIVGLGIFLMNLDAAREVYTTARRERSLASAEP